MPELIESDLESQLTGIDGTGDVASPLPDKSGAENKPEAESIAPASEIRDDVIRAARSHGLSEDEIRSFKSESLLIHALNGMDARQQWEEFQNRKKSERIPATASVPIQNKLEIKLDKDQIDDSISSPLQQIVEHVNKMQEQLARQLQDYGQYVEQLKRGQEELSTSTASSNAYQDALVWDSAVEANPHLKPLLGKASEVMFAPDSDEAARWQLLQRDLLNEMRSKPSTPQNRAMALAKVASKHGWTATGNAGNGKKSGPGTAFRSSARTPEVDEPSGGREDLEAFLREKFAEAGGRNPFLAQ